jgi:hypothetical protein
VYVLGYIPQVIHGEANREVLFDIPFLWVHSEPSTSCAEHGHKVALSLCVFAAHDKKLGSHVRVIRPLPTGLFFSSFASCLQ